jgi:hypothetical protein
MLVSTWNVFVCNSIAINVTILLKSKILFHRNIPRVISEPENLQVRFQIRKLQGRLHST